MHKSAAYRVHPKEKGYFIVKVIAAIFGYFMICGLVYLAFNSEQALAFLPLSFYIVVILLYLFFRFGIMIGYLKGNAVEITEKQFPAIYSIVVEQSNLLGLKYIPEVYLLQNGGILNAFATRFFGFNYVVIYSDVMEEAFEDNIDTVKFIMGHELGHLKRRHRSKSLWLFPSFFVPFLNSAYSRGCEYTCDNIGAALSPNGARRGLLLLAAGKKLWKKVNTAALMEQGLYNEGFWFWFAEKTSSHPHLTKRIARFGQPQEIMAERKNIEISEVLAN